MKNPDGIVAGGWLLEDFPRGIHHLLAAPMLLLNIPRGGTAAQIQYSLLVAYAMQEAQVLVGALHQRYNHWMEELGCAMGIMTCQKLKFEVKIVP
jgi:hypothetical protein